MNDPRSGTTGGATEAMRNAWKQANIRPLWENPVAHQAVKTAPPAHLWKWDVLEPLVAEAMTITSMAAVERRVLTLVAPEGQGPAAGTVANITAALQILMPGESARPHRHSMNAIRFVLKGQGATTTVNGKACTMNEGDLVLTPGGAWHEHSHEGNSSIIWLDALDAPLHRYLGTDAFEPGPTYELPDHPADSAFATANIVPVLDGKEPPFSPVFRYPWNEASQAVAAAPVGRNGARQARYVNPLTGGSAMPLLDCYVMQIDGETIPMRTSSNAVCAVVEGRGTSTIGEETLSWGPRDVFSIPHGNWTHHRAVDGPARLFVVSDRDAFERLGLLREEYGNQG